jgi:hypothetical protein
VQELMAISKLDDIFVTGFLRNESVIIPLERGRGR